LTEEADRGHQSLTSSPRPIATVPLVDAEHVEITRLTQWRTWLRRNHDRPKGVWLIYPRSAKGGVGIAYDEMVDEAICWGWIDARPGRVDEHRAKLYFAPRKPTSSWSAKNKARVERLDAAGRLQAPGIVAIEAAKQSGTWDRLNEVENLEIPDDLQMAFRNCPGALENFQSFSRSNQRMVLEWINTAKRPETRARRLEETASKAAVGEVANLWSARKR
jgi:uncharacterized protein YdeI (YjbR/CyaY-like superfamily)